MNTIVPKVTGKVKRGHIGRTDFGNTRTILKILYYYRLVQGKNGCGDSAIRWMSGDKKANSQEKSCENCEFNKYLEGIRLRPISFNLISTVSRLENSRLIFVVKAATVTWSTGKFRKFVWGS